MSLDRRLESPTATQRVAQTPINRPTCGVVHEDGKPLLSFHPGRATATNATLPRATWKAPKCAEIFSASSTRCSIHRMTLRPALSVLVEEQDGPAPAPARTRRRRRSVHLRDPRMHASNEKRLHPPRSKIPAATPTPQSRARAGRIHTTVSGYATTTVTHQRRNELQTAMHGLPAGCACTLATSPATTSTHTVLVQNLLVQAILPVHRASSSRAESPPPPRSPTIPTGASAARGVSVPRRRALSVVKIVLQAHRAYSPRAGSPTYLPEPRQHDENLHRDEYHCLARPSAPPFTS
ncbi:hypothetical protein DFH09DRAFT_1371257 [Mycena vulgaris]|nr:hypothetical protein DFH09DRAFT_1371257 [Mycena vulgaris]